MKRRDFLKVLGIGAAAVVTTEVVTKEAEATDFMLKKGSFEPNITSFEEMIEYKKKNPLYEPSGWVSVHGIDQDEIYPRQKIRFEQVNSSSVANAEDIVFPQATEANNSPVVSISIMNLEHGGKSMYSGLLDRTIYLEQGMTLSFIKGSIVITFN